MQPNEPSTLGCDHRRAAISSRVRISGLSLVGQQDRTTNASMAAISAVADTASNAAPDTWKDMGQI
jgi:hypothetical protein